MTCSAAGSACPGLSDEPAELAEAARLHLRAAFLRARVAISGANFAAADTGTICVVESEGNGRMCTTLPEVLITVMGVEKAIPRFRDLEVLLQLLPRSATGERMNPYTSLWTGVARGTGRKRSTWCCSTQGGPGSWPTRPAGRRCDAFAARRASTSALSTARPEGTPTTPPYAGPIGAILAPQLSGESGAVASLPFASSLCGACYDVCPVLIDIPSILVHERGKVVAGERGGLESRSLKQLGRAFATRAGYERAQRLAARCSDRSPETAGSPIFHRGRSPPGDVRVTCPPCRHRRSANGGGVALGARDEILARIRAALVDRPAVPDVPRAYRQAGELGPEAVLALFTERVRDYEATVVVAADPRAAAAEAFAAAGARRIGIAPDLDDALRAETVELVEDEALTPRELDALDGALTTCAAGCAETGTIALDGGVGQGRRALSLVPDLHVCVVRAGAIVETVPELIAALEPSARAGRPIVLVSGPSATSDIELNRVEGVHGPRRLVVIVATDRPRTLSATGRGAAW